MGGLNWEAGLAGFGKGMLTGYQNVMEMKMKEDFMNRMEEARLVRDKNMAQWKEKEIEAPIRLRAEERQDARYVVQDEQWDQKFGLEKQELGLRQQSIAETARHNKAMENRVNKEFDPTLIKQKALAIYEAQQEVAGREADSLYQVELKRTGDPIAASMVKNDFLLSGFTDRGEYSKVKASSGSKQFENVVELARTPTQKAWESIDTAAKEDPANFLETATKQFGKGFKDVGQASQYAKQAVAAENYAVAVATLKGGSPLPTSSAKVDDTAKKSEFTDTSIKLYADAIQASKSKGFTEEQADKFNTQVLPNYQALTPEQKQAVQAELQRRQNNPGVLRGIGRDLYNAFSER